MKRIFASVGLVALGAATVHAQASGPAPKWWSASATLRGFYDDNFNTTPNGSPKQDAFGYQVNPSVGISIGNDQTSFDANYAYSFLYFDHKPAGNSQKYDQDHTFTAALNHAFSERYRLRVRDSFVVGQEPDALRAGNAINSFYRISGNNMVNYGSIIFNAEITPIFGTELGYDNAWYDYSDEFSFAKNVDGFGNIIPSRSGALDRIENRVHIDGRWTILPETVALLGYAYGQVNYTADEPIDGNVILNNSNFSDVRNSRSHTGYAGIEHRFNPDLYGAVQAGASYYDYYNDPNSTTGFGPYVRAVLTYTYAQESSLQVGFQESRTATDLVGGGGNYVHDSETSVIYGNINQRIAPHLYGSVKGLFQNSTYNGGGPLIDGKSDRFFQAGVDLEYRFNRNFSTHAGYDYDRLSSDIKGRDYDRNKVYMGVTASY